MPDIETQRQFWNDWDRSFREERELDRDSARRRDEVLAALRRLDLPKPRILEIGCANGWLSAELAAFGPVVATDLADEVVAIAKQRYPHIEFVAGNFQTIDLPNGFDVVVCLETLGSVEDQNGFVERMAERLRPGGYLLLTTQNAFVYERRRDVAPVGPGQVRRWTTRRELSKLLRPYFDVRSIRTIIPANGSGVLRIAGSYKVNAILGRLLGRERVLRLKEALGLGTTLLAVGRSRPR